LCSGDKTNTDDITLDAMECKLDKNTEEGIVDTVEYKEDTSMERMLLK
jgi:hypothetical protein